MSFYNLKFVPIVAQIVNGGIAYKAYTLPRVNLKVQYSVWNMWNKPRMTMYRNDMYII